MKKIFAIYVLIITSYNFIFSQTISIDPISGQVLKVEVYKDTIFLGSATGLIVNHRNINYLVTNWHVVSGIDYYRNKYFDSLKRTPNRIKIYYCADTLGKWIVGEEKLKFVILNKWYEIKINNKLVDVIALKLYNIPEKANIYNFELDLDKTDIVTYVSSPVSIVGFPYGYVYSGNFPIWKTGHIASEPEIDINDLPYFLIDATTRPGMSGSPVLFRAYNSCQDKAGSIIYFSGIRTLFMGIYSAQSDDKELGTVWKPIVVRKLLESIK